jgi:cation transport regulator ChaC
MLVFGFGSLMNPESLAKTSATAVILRRVTLHGYQRKANAMHEAYSEVAMNIVPSEVFDVTGVLIDYPEADLPALRRRETGYEMVDITEHLTGEFETPVYTFIAPNRTDYQGRQVSSEYIQICLAGVPEAERERWLLETIVECGISDEPRNREYRHA